VPKNSMIFFLGSVETWRDSDYTIMFVIFCLPKHPNSGSAGNETRYALGCTLIGLYSTSRELAVKASLEL